MVKIGSFKIDTNIFLAPMAGCTDLPFRLIAREHGAKFCFYEMVDANALVYNRGKNLAILKSHKKDQPIAAQILGEGPEKMLAAAKKLLSIVKPAFLDINAGCPVKKVIKKKAGSYLLKTPQVLFDIIRTLDQELDLPISVKLRVGFNEHKPKEMAKIARGCEKSGAAALFVHGRTCQQLYRGKADYESIKVVKDNVSIPVFGSGDVFDEEKSKQLLDETGCDGILVARGSLGNPWIFKRIESYLKTGKKLSAIEWPERKETLIRHLKYIDKYKIARPGGKIGYMRKIAIWHLKSLRNAAALRNQTSRAESLEDLLDLIGQV